MRESMTAVRLLVPVRGGVLAACVALVALAYGCSSPVATPDATYPDGGVDPDAASSDGGSCEVALPRPDAGAPDAAVCSGSIAGSSCKPQDVSAFAPVWAPPAALHQGRCSDTDVTMLIDCKFNEPGGDLDPCPAYLQAHQDCNDCLFTPEKAATHGPLVVEPNTLVVLNGGGCVAQLEPCNLACGQAMSALQQCVEAACASACPVTDQASAQDLDTCQVQASKCECARFLADRSCYDAVAGRAGPAAVCERSSADFVDQALKLGALFCGK